MLCVDLQIKKVMFVLMNKAAEFFFEKYNKTEEWVMLSPVLWLLLIDSK